MENKRALIISLVCAIISILLISAFVKVRTHEITSQFGELVYVVIASKNEKATPITEYKLIKQDQLELVPIYKKFVQPSAVVVASEDEKYEAFSKIVGRSSYVDIAPGEQITLTKLISHEGKTLLDRQIAADTRAVTLAITQFSGVGRLIRPGDRVDILTTVHYEMKGEVVFEVKTILQNVLVLATGRSIQNEIPTRVQPEILDQVETQFLRTKRKDWGSGGTFRASSRPSDDYDTLTIQVTPEEAKKILFLVESFGSNRLYFTLRNKADTEIVNLETTLLDNVLGPESDYGRSLRKPPQIPPLKPRFYDNRGGESIPIY